MRDVFRNLTYDVTGIMKVAWDLEDKHALEWGQHQVTAKVASAGDPGAPSLESEVTAEPLSEAKSQMRAFMKEVSAWILECKACNAEYKLARTGNDQVGDSNW